MRQSKEDKGRQVGNEENDGRGDWNLKKVKGEGQVSEKVEGRGLN